MILISISAQLLKAPHVEGINIWHKDWLKEAQTLKLILDTGKKLEQIKTAHDKWLLPKAWEYDVLEIQRTLGAYASKWWRIFSSTYRRARSELAELCRENLPKSVKGQLKLADLILETQRLRAILEQNQELCQNLFQAYWQGEVSDWNYLGEVTEWITFIYQDAIKNHASREILKILSQRSFQHERLESLHTKTGSVLNRYLEAINEIKEQIQFDAARHVGKQSLLDYSFQEQLKLFAKWHKQPEFILDIVEYNHQADQFCELGLEALLPIVESWPDSRNHLAVIVERAWYNYLVREAFHQYPVLVKFSGNAHLADIDQFQKTDLEVLRFNRMHLANKHRQNFSQKLNDRQQLRIIKREFAKKSRHLPIRKLMEVAGETIQAVKPVFMMSPHSIAQFLPPGAVSFDLVVFDEASQVRPAEAFGALVRGKQAVVVGDQKQLPPTSFFEKEIEIEDELAVCRRSKFLQT